MSNEPCQCSYYHYQCISSCITNINAIDGECRDLDEVIQRSNRSPYGLAAGVFTQNIDTANTLTRALRAGNVWVNCYDVFDATIPFGGYKMSGLGREKGMYGLNSYLQVKAVVTPLKNPAWL